MVSLHPGNEQKIRDTAMRMTLQIAFDDDDWTEEEEMVLAQTWRGYLLVFYHDAREAVDDWWGQFGGLMMGR
jgi:hypothetical protein